MKKIDEVNDSTDSLFASIVSSAKELGLRSALVAVAGLGVEYAGAIQEALHQSGMSPAELAAYALESTKYVEQMQHLVEGMTPVMKWVTQAKFMLENPAPMVSATLQKAGTVTQLASPVIASASLLLNVASEAIQEVSERLENKHGRRM